MAVRVVARAFLPIRSLSPSPLLCSPLLFLAPRIPLAKRASFGVLPSIIVKRSYTTSTVGIEDAQTLVEREHFIKVKKILESDARKKISYKEFEKICSKEGLSPEQSKQLSQSLSDSGDILYFSNSSNAVLRDYVFLKPLEFNRTVARILAELSDDTYLREELAKKQQELVTLKAELQPLQSQKDALISRSESRAKTIMWAGFGYCVVQAALVARLTWWELSWDVMEPVTYMLTFAVVLLGYSYFVLTGTEYTFEGLRRTLERRKLIKLIKKNNFDEATFEKLKQAVQIREFEVQRILEDIKSDPVTLHLKDPSKPIV